MLLMWAHLARFRTLPKLPKSTLEPKKQAPHRESKLACFHHETRHREFRPCQTDPCLSRWHPNLGATEIFLWFSLYRLTSITSWPNKRHNRNYLCWRWPTPSSVKHLHHQHPSATTTILLAILPQDRIGWRRRQKELATSVLFFRTNAGTQTNNSAPHKR